MYTYIIMYLLICQGMIPSPCARPAWAMDLPHQHYYYYYDYHYYYYYYDFHYHHYHYYYYY